MKTITLTRYLSSDEGTFGAIEIGNTRFATAELPWRDNKPNISCIPAGSYRVVARGAKESTKFKYEHYHLQNVPNRSMILIHIGNWAGDREKGYKSDVDGCIILGTEAKQLGGQFAVVNSKYAFNEFSELVGKDEFIINIVNAIKMEDEYD